MRSNQHARLVTMTIALLGLSTACSRSQPSAEHSAASGASTDSSTDGSGGASMFTVTPAQQARLHIITTSLATFRPSVTTTGTVQFDGDRSTQVLAPVSGPVAKLLVQPGAQVGRGDALATVTSPDFAAAVAAYRKAESVAQNLQRIADQDVQLFKTDAIARRDVEQAQTDAAGAEADRVAALEQVRALGVDSVSLSQVLTNPGVRNIPAVIRAPIGGTVVERLITPGQLLEAGSTPAFTIADLSTVWVMANVFESDIASVHQGEHAVVTSDATTTPFSGTVDYVSALVDPATRATAVRLVVQNRGDILKRDMFVRVAITTDRDRTGILVPAAAVLRDEENLPFVFIAADAGKSSGYIRRHVTVGAHVGDNYEITSGLAVGDRVVAEGALFLQFAQTQ